MHFIEIILQVFSRNPYYIDTKPQALTTIITTITTTMTTTTITESPLFSNNYFPVVFKDIPAIKKCIIK